MKRTCVTLILTSCLFISSSPSFSQDDGVKSQKLEAKDSCKKNDTGGCTADGAEDCYRAPAGWVLDETALKKQESFSKSKNMFCKYKFSEPQGVKLKIATGRTVEVDFPRKLCVGGHVESGGGPLGIGKVHSYDCEAEISRFKY